MTCYSFNYEWFLEIEDKVPHGIPYAYFDEAWKNIMVEVDVEEETFRKVSRELGWMY